MHLKLLISLDLSKRLVMVVSMAKVVIGLMQVSCIVILLLRLMYSFRQIISPK